MNWRIGNPWAAGSLAFALLTGATQAATPLRLQTNEVIALVGGGAWVAEQRDGYLESALRLTHPGQPLRIRNFGWDGDTVSSRPREVNYPSVPAQLRQFGVTLALLQFGQNESWAGESGLMAFRQDYLRLLDELGAVTPRLVLVTPLPFEARPAPAPDFNARNAELAKYVVVIRELAAQRSLPLIDLFSSDRAAAGQSPPWTTDGRQLSAQGQAVAALAITRGLDPGVDAVTEAPLAWFEQSRQTSLRTAVVAKNQLWFHYVRPTNWAFLAGDRVDQASSRDYRDRNIRWFPGEIEQFGQRLQQAEQNLDRQSPDAR